MSSNLSALSNIISSQVAEIESFLNDKNHSFPSLNEPFSPESEAARMNPKILISIQLLAAAADQLINTVRPPQFLLAECALAHYLSGALGTAIDSSTTEILREAGSKGMHVDEIAKRNGMDPQKLARVLRTLATRYIYTEVSPNVFANNRPSSMLDTGKPFEEIQKNPIAKYRGTNGPAALLGHFCDEMFKGSSSMADQLRDPATALSEEPTETPFNRALGTTLSMFDWLETPNNELRRERFGKAMDVAQHYINPELILQEFDWTALSGQRVVDVGGGIGSTSAVLAKNFPNLKIVVQDRPEIIEDAKKYWQEMNPSAISSGSVHLEAHDFFKEQPKRDVAIFLLRLILHDWSDKYARKILRCLRSASTGTTKLIIIDAVVPYACKQGDAYNDIPGGAKITAPDPLIVNFGINSIRTYLTDMNMLVGFNALERTTGQFVDLFASSGWKLESVKELPSSDRSQLICVPV